MNPVNVAATVPSPIAAVFQGANATVPQPATGFMDLISLLLSVTAPSTPDDPVDQCQWGSAMRCQTSPETDNANTSPPLASPDQIAAAMIKFMSNGTAAPQPASEEKKKTAPVQPVPVLPGMPVPTMSVPVPIPPASPQNGSVQAPPTQISPTPVLTPILGTKPATSVPGNLLVLPAANLAQPAMQIPTDTALNVSPAPRDSKAPIAFEMQLTQLTAPEPSAQGPAQQSAPAATRVAESSAAVAPAGAAPAADAPQAALPALLSSATNDKPATRAPIQAPQEAPEKIQATAAAAATADSSPQGNLFQNGFHTPPFAHANQTQPGPSESKPLDVASPPTPDIKAAGEATQARPAAAAQQISVRISRPESPSVDLHVVERGGQVQVAVRTPDASLESALRQDLGTLVHSLERSGFHAETFVPVAGASSSSQMNSQSDHPDTHPDFSQNGSFNQGHGQGSRGGHSRGDDPRQQQRFAAWNNALEEQA